MADVLKFPSEGEPTGKTRYVSIGFAAAGLSFSVLAATITGSIMMGRVEANVANVIEIQRRDHDELTAALKSLVTNVSSLSMQESSHSSQIDALRQLINQERADRLDAERRFVERMQVR